MSKLTAALVQFGTQLRMKDGTMRTPTDEQIIQLADFLKELSGRVDKFEGDEAT
jgi:hypothetical protein